ncbi:MAG: glycoside hydrolase family 88 protein [Clostridia bacterium]|nr:glycoside hydrolase family 88 protein [Clostridia bacterium]
MLTEKIELLKPNMYKTPVNITSSFIDAAIEVAINKLLENRDRLTTFTPPETINYKYEKRDNDVEWTSGLNTGVLWLAWELSGERCFYDAAKAQIKTYFPRFEKKTGLMNHDVGFIFTPSVVADYKLTGDRSSRELALAAAEHLSTCWSEKVGYVRRGMGTWPGGYRTLVDTMMNIPLLLWAGKESGNDEYTKKAISHYNNTAKYLVRADGSTYHHFQFDPQTEEPVGGLTLQGFSDESCWSRGHSWLVYGYPIAYSYTKDESILDVYRGVTYHLLNNLPSDYIPYWDLIFGEGSGQPRDASAAAVSVCGLLEMCKYLDDGDSDKEIYRNAADKMMKSLIQKCANLDSERDGLLAHVTHALPQGRGIDESAIYGDYFYLEALLRYKNPDWKMYW